jgi:hypothetical protein
LGPSKRSLSERIWDGVESKWDSSYWLPLLRFFDKTGKEKNRRVNMDVPYSKSQ